MTRTNLPTRTIKLPTPRHFPNVSAAFKPGHAEDSRMCRALLEREGTPAAIQFFAENHKGLTSYCYWFLLSTCWVSYTGHSNLGQWRELFSSPRKQREISIMKPDELTAFRELPDVVVAYRAHRRGETDWISYTLNSTTAARFARERGTRSFAIYHIDKSDILALFTRRGEDEIIVLDRKAPVQINTVPLLFVGQPASAKTYPDKQTEAASRDHSRITPEGKILGEQMARLTAPALELMASQGIADDRCQSCAFRAGTVPNGCPQTQMDVVKAIMEGVPFKCHQSPKDAQGQCSDLCHGWIAARVAMGGETATVPWEFSKEEAE